jgi:Cellulase N-terminal ig-like domain/Glycosyl hydrolase family 9
MPNNGWPEWFLPSVLARRPAVRINQLGYLPYGPKRATWTTDELLPVELTVVASHGSVALRGRTQPWPTRPEPTSGQSVHVIDFTDVTGAGAEYQVLVGEQRSHRFRIAQDLYGQLARNALGLFYLLRSGCPIDEQRAPGYGRPAGHTGVPPNRGDTAVPAWTGPEAARLYPDWAPTDSLDVSGGWYDAGDYGKYTVSGSIAGMGLQRPNPQQSGRPRRRGTAHRRRAVSGCRDHGRRLHSGPQRSRAELRHGLWLGQHRASEDPPVRPRSGSQPSATAARGGGRRGKFD